MSGSEFLISEERFTQISKLTGLVYIPELNGCINLSSVESILREDVARVAELNNPKSRAEMILHDGLRAIKKNGYWVNANNTEARIDGNYYPEIYKDNLPV